MKNAKIRFILGQEMKVLHGVKSVVEWNFTYGTKTTYQIIVLGWYIHNSFNIPNKSLKKYAEECKNPFRPKPRNEGFTWGNVCIWTDGHIWYTYTG